jgi:Fe-S cluster assembly protein SufB
MLEWRLKAYRAWLEMEEVTWAKLDIPKIDYQDAYYYAEPKSKPKLKPRWTSSIRRSAAPTRSSESRSRSRRCSPGSRARAKVAVDAVFDSVSVATTFREELKKAGVIFLSISEAIREHPELVRKYLGSVVPQRDNYLRLPQQRGLLRRHLRLHPRGRPLPDGAFDLFPDQCRRTPASSSAP